MARPSKRTRSTAREDLGADEYAGVGGWRFSTSEGEELYRALRTYSALGRDTPAVARAKALGHVIKMADRFVINEVDLLRKGGASWREIGAVWGISRQAATERTETLRKRVGGRWAARGASTT